MKNEIRPFAAGIVALALATSAFAAAENQSTKEKHEQLRVLTAPDHWRMRSADDENVEKETVAFLGVETSTVSATVSAQLSLPRGTGLTVNHIVPKSPAAEVLQPHDILLKLDDQILIEVRQLAVLIRNHKEGDEVTLSYVRGGQKSTAKVKLGKQEVPKLGDAAGGWFQPFGNLGDGAFRRFELAVPGPDGEREHMDRVLSLIGRAAGAPDGPPGFVPEAPRIRIERGSGPTMRAMSINTRNSNIAYSDDAGTLDLAVKDGVKTLVAKDAKGEQLFSGPVTTAAERDAMPKEVRARLEKLEGMNNLTFHTDGDFQGAEMKVFRPRGISLPLPLRVPMAQRSLFY